jgi:outer membrane protein assembly factor BamE (lipoprotein component of BamABCDE complex)
MARSKRALHRIILGLAITGAGCAPSSRPVNYRDPENRFWGLLVPETQKQIVRERYDRARLLKEMGPPTIDDGEEWVYVGKFEDTSAVNADMLMAITASLDDPTWKTIVVTFSPSGIVEQIGVTSSPSAVAERRKQGIFLGAYYNRGGRVRAATTPTTGPTGGGAN